MDLLKKRLDIARLVAEELTGTIDEKNRIVLSRAGETINGIPMESGEISYGPEDRSVDYVE